MRIYVEVWIGMNACLLSSALQGASSPLPYIVDLSIIHPTTLDEMPSKTHFYSLCS